ncbi:MAG: hypothetical protein ACD_73C00107G0002 [uncultured bacterium]|nr:MAG: hypothetical protein ACD_73C00107G0002 [uncultured bacterium]
MTLPKQFTKKDFLNFFVSLDLELNKKNKKLELTILGGAALILLDLKDRATHDIDIAPHPLGKVIEKILRDLEKKKGVPIQPVTVTSTVDFKNCEKKEVYKGLALRVESISLEDLIKSKLERFQKQDPEDIYTIIEKINFSYESFKNLVKEMFGDFVGAPIRLAMQASTVVEQIYPDRVLEFQNEVKKFYA